MICNKCHNSAVINQANGKDFYFCQTCRVEVSLEDKFNLSEIESFDRIEDFYKHFKAEDEPGTDIMGYDDDPLDDDEDDMSDYYGKPYTLSQEEIDKMFSDIEQEGTDRD